MNALEDIVQPIAFRKGTILFGQGEPSYGLFIISSGRVKLTSVTVRGSINLFAIAEGGGAIGLPATVCGRPHVASAITTELTNTVFIRRNSFLQFIKTHGDAAVRVAQVMAEVCHEAHVEMKQFLGRESAAGKLARFVLNLSAQQPEDGDQLRLRLTHEEIGNMIGTARETVTRTLHHMKSRKILRLQDSQFIIYNRPALKHIASA
jgi:CRP/FNR family cyclic AMP-dependent transcriptional regulator